MNIRDYRDQSDHLVLPAIQRGYVWDEYQICQLFDSIMREYPIGNLLLWELDGQDINEKGIDFYSLLPSYDEQAQFENAKVKNVSPNSAYLAILDGQQRSQSILIGLGGFLRVRKRYAPVGKADSYEKKYLYINLLTNLPEESNFKYNFAFLTKEKAIVAPEQNEIWFPVGAICQYAESPSLDAIFSDYAGLTPEQRQQARAALTSEQEQAVQSIISQLYRQICEDDEVLPCSKVSKHQSLDDILDIFVRTNSGGTKLDKTDLLFSTIVTSWHEARDEIEDLIIRLNDQGEFKFSKDFVMRSLLYMLDESVALKVNDLRKNIQSIRENWSALRSALVVTRDLLEEFGYNHENLKAYNSVMPIAYYVYKSGIIGDAEKEEFKKYLAISHLKQLYGVASNSALMGVRSQLMDYNSGTLRNPHFRMSDLSDVKLTGNRDFLVDDSTIDAWLLHNKKDSYSFYVLSLLYPDKELLRNKYHQDHMHPESKLKEIPEFRDSRNRLANLQLLPGLENEHKNATSLITWLQEARILESEDKIERNYLQHCAPYTIEKYPDFLLQRGKNMKNKLKQILQV